MSAPFSKPARLQLDALHRLFGLMLAVLTVYGGWQAVDLLRSAPPLELRVGEPLSLDLSASSHRLLLDHLFAQKAHAADRN